jgi:ribosomal protein S18 acetylase RimI-like enzyme
VTGIGGASLRAFVAPHASRPRGIAFRAIVDADLSFLAGLYASIREQELAPVPWSDEAKLAFLADQFAQQHRYYQNNYVGADFLLVLRGDAPIGRVYVYRSAGEIRLMDIALIDAERGRGLGTSLLAELMDEARADSAEITLHVEPNNPACRLYERLGFRLIENRGVYLFLGWRSDAASDRTIS